MSAEPAGEGPGPPGAPPRGARWSGTARLIALQPGASPVIASLSGYWARRITEEHRLVYRHEEGRLRILSCRYHFE